MRRYPVCMWHLLALPAAVVVEPWPAPPAPWMLYWLVFALLHPPLSRLRLQPLLPYLLHRQQSLQPRRLPRRPWQRLLHVHPLPAWHCPRLPVALLSFAPRSWLLGAEPVGQFPIVVSLKRSTHFRPSLVGLRSAGSSGMHTSQRSWQGKMRRRTVAQWSWLVLGWSLVGIGPLEVSQSKTSQILVGVSPSNASFGPRFWTN